MAANTIIFDSTFTRDYRINGEAGWDEPLPGASLSAWMQLWMVMPWHPPGYIPNSGDFLRVIDAVLGRRGFPTGKDVYKYGPQPWWSQTNYGTKTAAHSFQLDFEISYMINRDPSYYANIMTDITKRHPGIRLLTYWPPPLFGFNDNGLKVSTWTPTTDVINQAAAYATRNAGWINQLWGLVISIYFGAPWNDQTTIWLAYNMIKLARQVYPTRRIIIQTCGGRDTSWYPAGGIVPDNIINQFAGVMRSAHPDGVIIWGNRSLNRSMLAAFGVDVSSLPIPASKTITTTTTTSTKLSPTSVNLLPTAPTPVQLTPD